MAQEAFLRIIGDRFDPTAFPSTPHLLAWLNKIVRNAVTDMHRHHAAQLRDGDRDVAGGDLFPGLADDTTAPGERAERNERNERVARLDAALQSLPDEQRKVVLLRFREDKPFKEIAKLMKVTEGYARVLVDRAKKRLREQMGDQS